MILSSCRKHRGKHRGTVLLCLLFSGKQAQPAILNEVKDPALLLQDPSLRSGCIAALKIKHIPMYSLLHDPGVAKRQETWSGFTGVTSIILSYIITPLPVDGQSKCNL